MRICRLALKPLRLAHPAPNCFSSARRFLFLQYEAALGASVLSSPVFEILKNAIPDAYVAAACSGVSHQVLKHNRYIDTIYETPHPISEFSAALEYFATTLRKKKTSFEFVICNAGNSRTKIALLALLSGIHWRIGFETSVQLFHRFLKYDSKKAVLTNNLRILEPFGITCETREPRIFYTTHELALVRTFLCESGVSPTYPIVAVATQSGGGEPNEWFFERFVALGRALIMRHKAQLIFTGVRRDRALVERIRTSIGSKTFSAAGDTDVPQLAALFSQCDLLVTIDTGAFHVARSVRLPSVVIGNASRPHYEWLPNDNPLFVILRREDVPCALCRTFHCATRECMQNIHVEDVLTCASAQLTVYPPSMAHRAERTAECLVR